MDTSGGNARELTHNDVEEVQPEFSPDNARSSSSPDANEKFEPYYNSNVFVMPADGGHAEAGAAGFSVRDRPGRLGARRRVYSGSSPTWACTARSSRSTSPSRHWRPLTSGDHYIPPRGGSVVPPAGRMVFQFDEPTRFGDVWTMAIPASPTAAASAPARVTGTFDSLDRDVRAAAPGESVVEGRRRHDRSKACSSIPRTTSPARRYPLVVQMHGGPRRLGQVRRWPGAAAQLLSGADRRRATPCCGRTIVEAAGTETPSIATWSAATSRTCSSTS